MSLRKLFAIAVGSSVLGAQLWMVAPPFDVSKTWYWPFMNYPMYSASHDAGAVFTAYALLARSCTPGRTPVVVSAKRLGIGQFRMYAMLAAIGEPDSSTADSIAADSSIALLNHLARTRSSSPLCSLQLRAQSIMIGPDGVRDAELSWDPVREWRLSDESPVVTSAASSPPPP